MGTYSSISGGQHAGIVGLAPKRERSGFEDDGPFSTCPTVGIQSSPSMATHPLTTGKGEGSDVYGAPNLDGLMICLSRWFLVHSEHLVP